jgi:large subunit ribosomal protein L21
MKYAVLQTGGKQYKVTEGSVIEVERLNVADGANFVFDKVLMVADEGTFTVGQPVLDNVSVNGTVLEHKRGKKIRVAKFKAKARYRKVIGHRQELTKVQIDSIGASKVKAKKTGDKEE